MPMPLSHAYSIWILAMHLLYYYLDIIHHLCTSTAGNTLDFYYLYLVSTIVPGLLGPLGTLVLGRIDTILQHQALHLCSPPPPLFLLSTTISRTYT